MSSVYGFMSDIEDPEALTDDELAEALTRVEHDHEEAVGWEEGYASEVDRLKTLWDNLIDEDGRRKDGVHRGCEDGAGDD